MNISTGKAIRLGNLINPKDRRALWLDLSIAGKTGAKTSYRDFYKTIAVLGQHCDGAIVNPGFLEKAGELFGGTRRWAPIVLATQPIIGGRMDFACREIRFSGL
ncbi:MAG: hypothetical protein COT43_10260 [Candidatus Marinimicrobia bacterium CG08_land_8_20_14_0_20_45_22]|nr:MAG: hypothetical protein COT43_10260 [Candidatus Marinimicrobia bacterium CG08_land_8_20_14_0_20_45_22]